MKSSVFWNITLCSVLVNQPFGETFHLRLQVQRISQSRNQHEANKFVAGLIRQSWRWRQHVPPKHWLTFSGPHGIISQKIELFNNRIVVKKFLAFCGRQRFITLFTRASHWALSWTSNQSVFSPYLLGVHLTLPSVSKSLKLSLSFMFSNQTLNDFSCSHVFYVPFPSLLYWIITIIIYVEMCKLWRFLSSSLLQSSMIFSLSV
jgi:hypothetical protein